MSHVRASKQELKRQRDALARFERYLPTLQLKKRQLELELRRAEARLAEARGRARDEERALDGWVGWLSEPVPLSPYLGLERVERGSTNIAGVEVPTLEGVAFRHAAPDPFDTPAYLDDALAALERLWRLQLETEVLDAQRRRLAEELRTTAQRVNLFEKVKIPDARHAIRGIRIALGDQQAAEVVRAKIAKGKGRDEGVPG